MAVNRRGFMNAILVSGIAPAVVRAGTLMRIKPIVLPGEVAYERIIPITGWEPSIFHDLCKHHMAAWLARRHDELAVGFLSEAAA